jgi:ribonuclease HI
MKNRILIITDGSAIGNPGPGGWAAIFACERRKWSISGAAAMTTASEMELTAAVEALRSVEMPSVINLRSDSEYLIRGMRHLVTRWAGQGWRNNRGTPLQNVAHWQELCRLATIHHIDWRWVRGHNGHPIQTQADELAYFRAREAWVRLRAAA